MSLCKSSKKALPLFLFLSSQMDQSRAAASEHSLFFFWHGPPTEEEMITALSLLGPMSNRLFSNILAVSAISIGLRVQAFSKEMYSQLDFGSYLSSLGLRHSHLSINAS
jgi:hypothetical protein